MVFMNMIPIIRMSAVQFPTKDNILFLMFLIFHSSHLIYGSQKEFSVSWDKSVSYFPFKSVQQCLHNNCSDMEAVTFGIILNIYHRNVAIYKHYIHVQA